MTTQPISLCGGIDYNTRRIDLALIPLDPDYDKHQEPRVLTWHRTSIHPDSITFARDATAWLLRDANHTLGYVATICIEKPAGRVHPTMHEMHGALRASIPPSIPSTGLYPVQWRTELGLQGRAKNSKTAGLDRVLHLYPSLVGEPEWDEHALDALGIAHAWRAIQWQTTT